MKILLALVLFFSISVFANEMTAHQFIDGKLNINMPTELDEMSDTILKKRYGEQKLPPQAAFSNKDHTVTFTVTQYPMQADKKSMRRIHNSLSKMLRSAHPKAKWKKDKVYNNSNTRMAVFEYEIQSVGQYHYYITYALPVNNTLVMLSFLTTDKKYKTKWVKLAKETFDTITIQ